MSRDPHLLISFCKVLGLVCFSLLSLCLWAVETLSSCSVFSTKRSADVAYALFLVLSHRFCIQLTTLTRAGQPLSGTLGHCVMMWDVISNCFSYQGFSIGALSCKVLCDILITVGMVYTFLTNRTQFRRYAHV